MAPAVAGGAIAAGGSLLGSAMNRRSQRKAAEEQHRYDAEANLMNALAGRGASPQQAVPISPIDFSGAAATMGGSLVQANTDAKAAEAAALDERYKESQIAHNRAAAMNQTSAAFGRVGDSGGARGSFGPLSYDIPASARYEAAMGGGNGAPLSEWQRAQLVRDYSGQAADRSTPSSMQPWLHGQINRYSGDVGTNPGDGIPPPGVGPVDDSGGSNSNQIGGGGPMSAVDTADAIAVLEAAVAGGTATDAEKRSLRRMRQENSIGSSMRASGL